MAIYYIYVSSIVYTEYNENYTRTYTLRFWIHPIGLHVRLG